MSESCCDAELVPWPRQLRDSSKGDTATTTSDLYCWRINLAKVQNRLCEVLCRRESVPAKLAALTDIDQGLTTWRDNLPAECRPELEILVHPDLHNFVASLHLEYFNTVRALHWASMTLTPALTGDPKWTCSPRIRRSEVICIAAARSFIKTLIE